VSPSPSKERGRLWERGFAPLKLPNTYQPPLLIVEILSIKSLKRLALVFAIAALAIEN
jgi:hypothetical protein